MGYGYHLNFNCMNLQVYNDTLAMFTYFYYVNNANRCYINVINIILRCLRGAEVNAHDCKWIFVSLNPVYSLNFFLFCIVYISIEFKFTWNEKKEYNDNKIALNCRGCRKMKVINECNSIEIYKIQLEKRKQSGGKLDSNSQNSACRHVHLHLRHGDISLWWLAYYACK